eukprot:gene37137-45817_t
MTMARSSSNTASTPTPITRNGSSTSQTSGYSSKASRASGQHKNSRTSHNTKLSMMRSRTVRYGQR